MVRITDMEDDDIERLKRIRSVLYQFLVPGTAEGLDMLELRPKTYTEAVKCYLEVDLRINEKKGEGSSPGLGRWEEIVLRCSSPSGVARREVENRSPRTRGSTDKHEASLNDAKSAGQ